MLQLSQKKIIDLLGIAQRANCIVSGDYAVQSVLCEKKAKLLLIAADAAIETKKNYEYLANKYQIPYHYVLTKESLGACIGKSFRAAVVIVDDGFAQATAALIRSMEKN